MSTRSRIGIVREDNTEQYIYCHWNGYLSHNGRILEKYYNTPEKVEKLIALGNISELGKTPDECNAYHRDGGEKLQFWDTKQEYNYTYFEKNKKWMVETVEEFGDTYQRNLKAALLENYLNEDF